MVKDWNGMLVVETLAQLGSHIGQRLGPSDWIEVTQARIDAFADCTGDHQWIHVDVERAAREMPQGKTIAHGWLTASLLSAFFPQLYRVESVVRRVNYGCEKIRFTRAVPVDTRLRAWLTLLDIAPKHGGMQIRSEVEVEIEGGGKPAALVEHLAIAYES